MGGIQYEYEFCDATSIIGDNNTLTRGTVDYKANAATNKTAWGGNINAQIGGMTFVATVTTALTAAMTASVRLATHTSNTLNAGTYISNLAIPANQNAGYQVSAVLPKGTTRNAYLGVVVVGAGNIAAGNINAYLLPSSVPITD
jgi:hypothetical protein